MKAYSFFAKVYDVFMNDIPYVDWLDGIEAYMERRNIQCHRVLELGCGTGRFTALLAADGYEVTGLDLSEAMIKVAKKKPFGKRISYVCSDMRNFNLGKKFDVVISVCDSMNYLLNNDDMYNTFLSVGKHLEKGGFFIFDLKTETFYEKLGENIYSELKSYTGSSRIRDRNDNKLVFDKVVQENPDAYPLFHSDRGYQYTSRAFHKKLLDAGMAQRISRVRHCISRFLFYHIMQERQRERVMVFDLGCLFKTKTQSSR